MSRIEDRTAFGVELARLREAAGLSQRAVGDRIEANGGERNVTGSAVGDWERGQSTPPPRTVVAIEKIVGSAPGGLAELLGYGTQTGSLTERVSALEAQFTRIEEALDRLQRRRR